MSEICSRPAEEHSLRLRGRFVAQVWATILILVLAISALARRATSVATSTIGILAVIYTLMLPYAYGKLRSTTWFDVGSVRFVPLRTSDGEAERLPVEALILTRNGAGASLLVTRPVDCGTAVGGEPTQDSQQQAGQGESIAMSFQPASQIAGIDLIFRQDVIEWAYKKERRCMTPGLLPG